MPDADGQDRVNPFIHGRALMPAELLGRGTELRRLVGRIKRGELTAIIGSPRVGKTSLLRSARDPSARAKVGLDDGRLLFRLLDAQALREIKTPTAFWELALAPVVAEAESEAKAIAEVCARARASEYAAPQLELVFEALSAAGSRFVLLLDEFDDLLAHEALNSASFYGALRSLGSRCAGFVVVIATRQDLARLNQLTQQFTPHGSPYFNVFTEIRLGALTQEILGALLDRAGVQFDGADRSFVFRVSGGHPYVAQAAASLLWDAIDDGLSGTERYLATARGLHRQTTAHFADSWRGWSNETRKAVTAVALAQFPALAGDRRFQVTDLVEHLDDYEPELSALVTAGVLRRSDAAEWSITQEAFLWWLADELRRHTRDETDFAAWIRAQEMDGLFTRQEEQAMSKALRGAFSALGRGAGALIEAFAKGCGEAAGKAALG